MMAGLRREVRDLARSVGHEPFLACYDELLARFHFTPAVGTALEEPAADPGSVVDDDTVRANFDLARSIDTAEACDAFLDQYRAREDALTVQMARRLRERAAPDGQRGLTLQALEEEEPTPDDRRAIIRRTQAQLNALGCDAGPADASPGGGHCRASSRSSRPPTCRCRQAIWAAGGAATADQCAIRHAVRGRGRTTKAQHRPARATTRTTTGADLFHGRQLVVGGELSAGGPCHRQHQPAFDRRERVFGISVQFASGARAAAARRTAAPIQA